MTNALSMPGAGYVSLRDDAPAFWNLDILWIMHATAAQTEGRWSLIEELCRKGSGAPPHIHEWSDETFYVLDGEISFLLGDDIKLVRTGAFVSIPRGTVHGFRVDSETARILNYYVPASWEAAVMELAVPAEARTLPPIGMKLPDMRRAPELMRTYGMQPVEMADPLRQP
jgi:mannose-6-phosphate isomerase-like protein (cupin superfamily)